VLILSATKHPATTCRLFLKTVLAGEHQCEALMMSQPIPPAEELLTRITIDPDICHGKPCIRGLRYPVEFLLELLSSGMTIEEILADYEDLEQNDLYAALTFATRLSQVKRLQPLAA
jgi:uncharacterized protein (DUF433 family)